MKKLERFIYDKVKDKPVVKDSLKKAYQGFFSLCGRSGEWGKENLVIRSNCFFGFHDKSPWSADNRMLLAHSFDGIGNEPINTNNSVKIVVFEGNDWQQKRVIGQTRAWNWQQGSQLQWRGQSDHLIYNDFVDGTCCAIEVDSKGEQVRTFDYPVAAMSPDGTVLAGFCFNTLGKAMPGYGYDFLGADAGSNIEADCLLVFDDRGLVEHSIEGLSLPGADSAQGLNGLAFISHAIFSQTGLMLAFMRRTAISGRRLRSALYVLNRETKSIIRVPFKDMVSHYCWLNDNELFCYANTDAGDGYYRYCIDTGNLEAYSFDLGQFDGHPHAEATGTEIVFDSYADRMRLQRLAVYNVCNRTVTELARLYSPMKFWGNQRVDLHPRFRADGAYVCFDCSTTGVRSLATLHLDKHGAVR